MLPSARPIAAAGHTAGLLLGGQEELTEPAVLRRLQAPHVTRHSYHATTRRERMLVPGETEPTASGSAEEVKNLLHEVN